MTVGDIGRIMLVAAVVLACAGGIFLLLSRLGVVRLPGDISVRTGGVSIAFPIVTCILLSVALTIVLNIILSLRR
ncbi:MAG: DUF2905 domain-containing protein [Candidatus Dormibacteraeota bacterium]|nr:DUF2905 domain-containing protein [Candidatus Dormibacteraeota bacterium]MBV8445975.1 DUF2905 domain-containing protein [Candidatus Dormibacteraeota bacterium]